jgi:uncharacterized membrane protein
MSETPAEATRAPHDERVHRVERLISWILRTGVALSLALILLGTAVSFIRHPAYVTAPAELRQLTRPGAAFPETISQVMAGLRQGQGRAIVVVGLMTLIATPVVRVAVSVLAFVYQRDRTFVVLTLVVLALLLASFALGKVEG